MTASVFFSIIIPTYNAERTLAKAIESILGQSFTNYEVLILDGKSEDNTLAIARGFNDARIKIFSEKDEGIYDAMNKGIKLATGEWLYFLGSDDFLFNRDVLKDVSLSIGAEDVDVVYGNVSSTRFGGLYDGEFDSAKIRHKNICHQSIFFRKTIFSRTGYFDTSFKAHADWDHNFKWFFDDHLKKKYVGLTIAEYAEGGFSSVNSDMGFFSLRNWKYMKAQKSRLSFLRKLVFFSRQCRILLASRNGKGLVRVVLEFPDFIF